MKKIVTRLICLILVLVCLTSCGTSTTTTEEQVEQTTSQESKGYTLYECNGRVISLTTKIEVQKEGDDFCTIKGNLFKVVTDPLTMYDESGNDIAYAGDTYHFINQDSHGIYVDKQFTYDMVGKFEFFGQEYEIYDIDEVLVATLKFSPGNFDGKLIDTNGTIIAEYSSFYGFKDFTIKIYDTCEIDETSVLMIFASYYSDYHYDSES